MARTDWKFSALPEEINLDRIVREASAAVNDDHEVIKVTVGRQVWTLCTYAAWMRTCPMVVPVGLVTRYTRFKPDGVGGLKLDGVASPFAFAGPDAVVAFNQDLSRKLRGGVEVKVEVF